MQYRPLGRSALKVSPLCFGGNVFGWTADERTSFSLLDAWVDAGCNFIDTADVYSRWARGHSGGESETVIGRWLKQGGRRDKVVIATKVGSDMGQGISLAPARIREAVEESLRRLQIDCIDLYQAHRDDTATPLEQTLEAFAHLIKQGKVRAIGASNYSAARLAEALRVSKLHNLPRYETLQPQYNLYDRAGYESGLEPLIRAEGIGVIGYYSLASGFLSGKYRKAADAGKSAARGASVIDRYLNPRGLRILQALDAVAADRGANPTQVALAWLIARPGIVAPIASATTTTQLGDLVAATRLALSATEIAALDAASAED